MDVCDIMYIMHAQVAIEFHQDDQVVEGEQLVEMRIYIPPAADDGVDDEETAAGRFNRVRICDMWHGFWWHVFMSRWDAARFVCHTSCMFLVCDVSCFIFHVMPVGYHRSRRHR